MPGHFKVRPTTDQAKEGLFNILENEYDLDKCRALDLFAGSGGISFELASRGCPDITSVELYRPLVKWLVSEAQALGWGDVIKVKNRDVFRMINKLEEPFDLIFADPPYTFHHAASLPQKIRENKLIKPGGLMVLEHSKQLTFNELEKPDDQRNYGSVFFSFFR